MSRIHTDTSTYTDIYGDEHTVTVANTETLLPMDDPINHPKHYTSSKAKCPKCETPIECITVTTHMNFNVGNAIKYAWRHEHKGNPKEDLMKAIWYLNQELKRIE